MSRSALHLLTPDPCLVSQDGSSCAQCGSPLCPAHLSAHPLHDTECGLLSRLEISCEDMDPVHNIIEVIRSDHVKTTLIRNCIQKYKYAVNAIFARCLRLRDSRPEQWRLVSALMAHDQERRAETERYISPYSQVIRALVTQLGAATEQEVVTMLGYFDVNSIAVRGAA